LELLAQGYKNAEIVAITGLSLNTIRTHTKIVYQKLEVNNAMDAIVRAKQLGMIEQS
jgi:LuxR family maltose regulon positive regulatory protein